MAQSNQSLQEDIDLALQYQKAGNLPSAADLYQKILQSEPDQPVANHQLGVIAFRLGKLEVAATLISKALTILPTYIEAHHSLGLTLQKLGRLDEAATHFLKAIDFKPDYAEAHYNLGIVHKELELRQLVPIVHSEVEMAHFNDFFYQELGVRMPEVQALQKTISQSCGIQIYAKESQHNKFFAALAVAGFRPEKILEIGTNIGQTTYYLATLFPDAQVTSVDLPTDDPIYQEWHPEGDTYHIENRRENLDHPNITFLQINTLWLQKRDLPNFDLIWLDGGHFYPEVSWDHFFCLEKLNPGGWLFSDDVTLPGTPHVLANPRLTQPFEVIDYINARMDGGFRFLLKRIVPNGHSSDKRIAFWHRE